MTSCATTCPASRAVLPHSQYTQRVILQRARSSRCSTAKLTRRFATTMPGWRQSNIPPLRSVRAKVASLTKMDPAMQERLEKKERGMAILTLFLEEVRRAGTEGADGRACCHFFMEK